MPAKAKYLSSGWTRFSRVMAAIFGAYVASMFIHIALAKSVPDDTPVLLTSTYTAFLGWVGFMIMIYLVKKVWISWLVLVLVSGLCFVVILL